MDHLMTVNGAAHGADFTYNTLRLAASPAKRGDVTVQVFGRGKGVTVTMDEPTTLTSAADKVLVF